MCSGSWPRLVWRCFGSGWWVDLRARGVYVTCRSGNGVCSRRVEIEDGLGGAVCGCGVVGVGSYGCADGVFGWFEGGAG